MWIQFEKPRVRGKYKASISDVYSIGYALKSDKYNKTTEAILNNTQGIFNKGKYVKEALEELNNSNFNIIKPEKPDTIPTKCSVEEMILREELKNWFVRKTK